MLTGTPIAKARIYYSEHGGNRHREAGAGQLRRSQVVPVDQRVPVLPLRLHIVRSRDTRSRVAFQQATGVTVAVSAATARCRGLAIHSAA